MEMREFKNAKVILAEKMHGGIQLTITGQYEKDDGDLSHEINVQKLFTNYEFNATKKEWEEDPELDQNKIEENNDFMREKVGHTIDEYIDMCEGQDTSPMLDIPIGDLFIIPEKSKLYFTYKELAPEVTKLTDAHDGVKFKGIISFIQSSEYGIVLYFKPDLTDKKTAKAGFTEDDTFRCRFNFGTWAGREDNRIFLYREDSYKKSLTRLNNLIDGDLDEDLTDDIDVLNETLLGKLITVGVKTAGTNLYCEADSIVVD